MSANNAATSENTRTRAGPRNNTVISRCWCRCRGGVESSPGHGLPTGRDDLCRRGEFRRGISGGLGEIIVQQSFRVEQIQGRRAEAGVAVAVRSDRLV